MEVSEKKKVETDSRSRPLVVTVTLASRLIGLCNDGREVEGSGDRVGGGVILSIWGDSLGMVVERSQGYLRT